MSAQQAPAPVETILLVVNTVGDECGLLRGEIMAPETPAASAARNEAIGRLYRMGFPSKVLAEAFGVSAPRIQQIVGKDRRAPKSDGLKHPGRLGPSILAAWPAIDAKLAERAQ